jgi:hypothetical protein
MPGRNGRQLAEEAQRIGPGLSEDRQRDGSDDVNPQLALIARFGRC